VGIALQMSWENNTHYGKNLGLEPVDNNVGWTNNLRQFTSK